MRENEGELPWVDPEQEAEIHRALGGARAQTERELAQREAAAEGWDGGSLAWLRALRPVFPWAFLVPIALLLLWAIFAH